VCGSPKNAAKEARAIGGTFEKEILQVTASIKNRKHVDDLPIDAIEKTGWSDQVHEESERRSGAILKRFFRVRESERELRDVSDRGHVSGQ
jgi:hypothetical protein